MFYKFHLLNEESIEEQEKILKYFYMIDSDRIAKELGSLPVPQNSDDAQAIDSLFHTVFEIIYSFSSLYNKFTNPSKSEGAYFFSEPGCSLKTEKNASRHMNVLINLSVFLKLSLRNHCIIQGFFHSLSKKNADAFVPLSAPYDKFLNSGYYSNPEYKKDRSDTVSSGDKSYQFYNSRYKSLRVLGNDSFLWKMLIDCSLGLNSSIPSVGERFGFKTPLAYKYWIYFIFMEDRIRTLSRNIAENTSSILKNYKGVFESFRLNEEKLDLHIDRFIFHTMGEYYFGFSSFSYINRLLGKVYRPSSDNDSYLGGYGGQILESLLSQLSLCPMPYARHLFMRYAFEALRYNKTVECAYLLHPPSIGAVWTSSEKTVITKEELSARGLILIEKYFHTLNNMTLPVLSCLWTIALTKLLDDNERLLDFYRTYIESHYSILTADFTSLSFSAIEKCCSEQRFGKPKNELHYSFSFEALKENLDFSYFKDAETFLGDIFSKEILSAILHDFLIKPYSNPQLADISDRLWEVNRENGDDLGYDTFRFNRAKNIFTLLS